MATLAPVLGGNAASFERPVESAQTGIQGLASVLGTLGNAYFGSQQNQPTAPAPRQPTQDEMFGEAWRNFQEQQGVSLDPSNPNYTQNLRRATPLFLQAHPEFAGQVGSLLSQYGVDNTLTPQQRLETTQEDAMVQFFSTPEGMIQQGLARMEATSADGVFDENEYSRKLDESYATYLQTEAELSRLGQEAQAVTDTSTISTQMWNAYTPTAETMVTAALTDVFGLVEQMRMNPGGRIELSQEEATAIGLPTNVITAENFSMVLTAYRNTLRQNLRSGLEGNVNVDASRLVPPSEDWYNQVLAPFDQVLEVAAQDFDSIPSIQNAVTDAGLLAARRRMLRENPELAATLDTLSLVPPEALQQLDLFQLGLSEEVRDYLILNNATDIPLDQRTERAADMSTTEAQDLVTFNTGLLATGALNDANLTRAFTDMFAGLSRTDASAYVGAETWNETVAKNAQQLGVIAQSDPEFARILADNLAGDLARTLTQVQSMVSSMPVSVVMNSDGTLALAVDEALIDQRIRSMGYTQESNPAQYMQERENLLLLAEANLQNSGVDLYNSKVSTLGQMNQVGAQVLDSVVMQNSNLAPVEPTGGGMSQSQSAPTQGATPDSTDLVSLVDRTEGGADYDTLFQFSNRDGGNFAGTRVSQMTIGELIDFAEGPYGAWSRQQLGYTATPMGRYQFVGSTLAATAEDMGLPRDTVFTQEVQDAMFVHKVNERLRGQDTMEGKIAALRAEWHGFNSVSDEELASAITAFETGGTLEFGDSGGGIMITPGLLAPTEAPRPYRRPVENQVAPQGIRPQARPTSATSEAPMRPVARSTGSSETTGNSTRGTASRQANKASKDKAVEVLLRNGFSREMLNALGIA